MDINEFVAHFVELLEETDANEIKASTNFRDLDEWSSLFALSIIAMVDELYDVALKGADIARSKTIEDLFNIVKGKK